MTNCTCLRCAKKINPNSQKNSQCRKCKAFCHPKCNSDVLRFRLVRKNKFRFKQMRDQNWVCNLCLLKDFPFSTLSENEFEIVACPDKKSFISRLPSPDVLNSLFTEQERYPTDTENNLSDEEVYLYTDDAHELSYRVAKGSPKIDFPIISINIRSIKNSKNFTKFEAFLSSLSVRPMLIALNETWISDTTKGPFRKIKGYEFVDNNRIKSTGGGVAFYVSNTLTYEKLDKFTKMEEKIF